jgi:transposase-like protein
MLKGLQPSDPNPEQKPRHKFIPVVEKLNQYEKEKSERQARLKGKAVCPDCGSSNSIKKGYAPLRDDGTRAQRYLCQDCKKNFLGDYERGPLDMPKKRIEATVKE